MLRARVPVGRGLLQAKTRRRQKPRLRAALPGTAPVKNPREDDPNPPALQCRPARPQPKTTRLLGVDAHATQRQTSPITFMKKSFASQRTTRLLQDYTNSAQTHKHRRS